MRCLYVLALRIAGMKGASRNLGSLPSALTCARDTVNFADLGGYAGEVGTSAYYLTATGVLAFSPLQDPKLCIVTCFVQHYFSDNWQPIVSFPVIQLSCGRTTCSGSLTPPRLRAKRAFQESPDALEKLLDDAKAPGKVAFDQNGAVSLPLPFTPTPRHQQRVS
jgi:hypothetical protein